MAGTYRAFMIVDPSIACYWRSGQSGTWAPVYTDEYKATLFIATILAVVWSGDATPPLLRLSSLVRRLVRVRVGAEKTRVDVRPVRRRAAAMPLFFVAVLVPCAKHIRQRHTTRLVRATAFLHREYEAALFWWEVLYLMQRLAIVGFVQYIPRDREFLRLLTGALLTLAYLMALLAVRPCTPSPEPNTFACHNESATRACPLIVDGSSALEQTRSTATTSSR